MLTAGDRICAIALTELVRWPDRLHRAWTRRLIRRAWLRGLGLGDVELGRVASRVVAFVRCLGDRLARRLCWAERLGRCGAPRVALRSLSQAVRGVSC